MKRTIFGLVLTVLVSGCALNNRFRNTDHETIAAYGKVEAIGDDFIVVGFGFISSHHLDSYADEHVDILKIYRCDSKDQDYCKYKIGDSVVAVYGDEVVRKNQISYAIKYLQNAKQEDVPVYRSILP